MSNNTPDYKDNLAFNTEKTKNKDFMIDDTVDLLIPEFIMTTEECHKNLQKAYEAKRDLENYIYKCCKRLAKLEKKQLIMRINRPYDVVVEEYYIAKNENDICEDNCYGDYVIDNGYAEYDRKTTILEDYSHE